MITKPKLPVATVNSIKGLLSLFLGSLFGFSLQAGLTTYPDPPNAVSSAVFSLTVDGTPVTVMSYMDYHYAHFAFDGTVSVKVSAPQTITSYKISPLSLGIQGQVNAGTNLTFSMDQVPGTNSTPRYLVLQINALEKLVLLGDPPETNAPASSGPGIFNVVTGYGADNTGATYTQPAIQNAVNAASSYGTPSNPGIVYVPAGIYNVRANLLLKDNVDFYLAPGSVLKADTNIANYFVFGGTIDPVLVVNNAKNVTIRGRGEVDASGIELMDLLSQTPPVFLQQSDAHPRRRILRTNNNGTSSNVVVNGVLFKDASGWSLELKRTLGLLAQNVKVLNHKNINWKIENDGIDVCSSSDALVNQCFVMTIDDAACSKATDAVMGSMDNVQFANDVFWTWSAGVKCGMQNDHPMNGVVFSNIDIVHCRRGIGLDTKTSQSDLGRAIPIENVLFEKIRVDEMEGNWNISNHDAVEFLLEDAPVNNVTIRNFTCPENRPLRCGPNYPANNVTFEDFFMNSIFITNVSQVTLAGSQPINNLVFASAHSVTLSGPPTHTSASFNVIATFNEPVTGLVAADFVATNATVSGLTGGPSVYTVTVTPTLPGWISVVLPAGAAQDDSFVDNLPSNLLKIPQAASAIVLPSVTSGTLYAHLTADDLGLTNGAAVTNWIDSANNRPFTGAATFNTNYANGHAGVRFNGTSNYLGNTNLSGAPNVAQVSFFIVANFTTAGNDSASDFLCSGQYTNSTSNNRFRILKRQPDGKIDVRVGGGSTLSGVATADTSVHVFSLICGRTAGGVIFSMDGKQLATGSSGTTEALQAFFLGAYGKTPDQFCDGTIGEVLLYNGGLSALDSTRAQDYLTRKYFGYAQDTDQDGLPDAWEMTQFGNLTASSGGSADSDRDGFTDLQEWIAGTEATDASSFFNIKPGVVDPDGVGIIFYAIPERRYVLETTDDLSRTNGWVEAASINSLPASGMQTLRLNAPTRGVARFARIRVSME